MVQQSISIKTKLGGCERQAQARLRARHAVCDGPNRGGRKGWQAGPPGEREWRRKEAGPVGSLGRAGRLG